MDMHTYIYIYIRSHFGSRSTRTLFQNPKPLGNWPCQGSSDQWPVATQNNYVLPLHLFFWCNCSLRNLSFFVPRMPPASSDTNASKDRSRTPPPTRGDIAQEFDDMWATLEPKLNTFKEGVKDAVKGMVVAKIEDLEIRMDKKFEEVKTESLAVKESVLRIEKMLAKSASVPSLGVGADANPTSSPSPLSYAAAASSQVGAPFPGPAAFPPPRPAFISPDELNASKFWRRPDQTVLFANTSQNVRVEIAKWSASISALAAEADLGPSLFKVSGDPLGSRLEVRFLGEESMAAHRAKQLLDSLKLGGGKYKDQLVDSPDNTKIQYYLNPDKPPCQVRKEILGKELFEILKAAKSDTTFTLQRAEAKIWANKKPICTVKVLSENEARISWEESRRIGLNIDLAQVEPAFAKVVLDKGEKWT